MKKRQELESELIEETWALLSSIKRDIEEFRSFTQKSIERSSKKLRKLNLSIHNQGDLYDNEKAKGRFSKIEFARILDKIKSKNQISGIEIAEDREKYKSFTDKIVRECCFSFDDVTGEEFVFIKMAVFDWLHEEILSDSA